MWYTGEVVPQHWRVFPQDISDTARKGFRRHLPPGLHLICGFFLFCFLIPFWQRLEAKFMFLCTRCHYHQILALLVGFILCGVEPNVCAPISFLFRWQELLMCFQGEACQNLPLNRLSFTYKVFNHLVKQ